MKLIQQDLSIKAEVIENGVVPGSGQEFIEIIGVFQCVTGFPQCIDQVFPAAFQPVPDFHGSVLPTYLFPVLFQHKALPLQGKTRKDQCFTGSENVFLYGSNPAVHICRAGINLFPEFLVGNFLQHRPVNLFNFLYMGVEISRVLEKVLVRASDLQHLLL